MTICASCGTTNAEGVSFCKVCGHKIEPSDSRVKCPACSQLNPSGVTYCWSCGAELPRKVAPQTEKPVTFDQGGATRMTQVMKKCSSCGRMVDPFARVCQYCGRGFGHYEQAPLIESKSPSSIWLNVAGILMIISGIVAFYTSSRFFLAEELVFEEYGIRVGSIGYCGVLEIIFGIVAILGGYLATAQRKFLFALIGSIVGMLSFGPLWVGSIMAFVGLLLIVIHKDDFKD